MLCIHYLWFCWVTCEKNLLEILNVLSLEVMVFSYSIVTFLIKGEILLHTGHNRSIKGKFLPIFAGIPW